MRYHRAMDDLLITHRKMTATDWLVDIVIALAAFGFGCLQLYLSVNLLVPDEAMRRFLGIEALVPTANAIIAVGITTLPLALRRKFPWPTMAFVLFAWLFGQTASQDISLSIVGPLVALFTIAYERPRGEAVAAACFAALLVLIVPTAMRPSYLVQLTLIQNLALLVAAALAGQALQLNRAYAQEAEARALAAERNRETEAQRRVEEERVRIAREVHDITAHSLSAVSIQAAVAERLVKTNPAAAENAIQEVRTTAKNALAEMRAMVSVLRSGEDGPETSPTAGSDRLPDLVAYLEGAGVDASLDDARYDRAAVPAFIDVALFGIAREACTNIVRHANATHASITLACQEKNGEQRAVLVVQDNGKAPKPTKIETTGHGLKGMEERVRLLNGTFRTGIGKDGGFVVKAEIPLETQPLSPHQPDPSPRKAEPSFWPPEPLSSQSEPSSGRPESSSGQFESSSGRPESFSRHPERSEGSSPSSNPAN